MPQPRTAPSFPPSSLLPPMRPVASHAVTEPIRVELSNGALVEFPASMPPQDIEQQVGRIEGELRMGGAMASHEPPGPSLIDRAVPMALRIGGAITGGVAGGLVSSPSIVGIPAGVMAGGAVGSGLGEAAAEAYEQRTGQREGFNPTQIGVQTLLGAVPMGKVAGATVPQIVARRAAQGAAMGGTATTATELAESGEFPSAGQVASGTVMGGLLGGVGGRVEAAGRSRPAPLLPVDVGQVVQHPQLGRVSVTAVNGDGTASVTRGGGRRWTVNVSTLAPAESLAELPAGARYVATSDGTVAPVGTDIPQGADPSFVRGVPAEYARREIAGLLPEGREPLITAPPAGSLPDTADRSFVRGVPAEYARREIRGELPAGPRFTADVEGRVAPVERAGELEALNQPRVPTADDAQVRSVRPAVIEREIDATVPAREGVRVRQYASDPNAVDAPMLSEGDLQVLRVMREDLAEFTPQRGRLVNDPSDPHAAVYARGGAGSPVGDDIRVISEQNVGNAEIATAIDDLLTGKAPTNRLHTAAIDAARGYVEGRSGYHGPMLPLTAERGVSGGGEPVAVDDFAAFSSIFDDVEPGSLRAGREPGEEGFIAPQLAAHLGGAAAGAAVGGATGDTPQERLENALLYGAAGAGAPALLRRSGATAGGFGNRHRIVDPRVQSARPPLEAVPPRSGRAGQPIADPMRGMAPFLAKFTNPLVRDGVERLITENNGYAVQRRGRIDSRQLGQFANEVRVNASRSLPKGTALNAESITAYARALQETQRKVNDLAQRINGGDDAAETLLALQAARAEADVVGRSLLGARAEAGRALAAFNFYRGILDTGNVNLIRDAVRAPGLREEAERLARGLADLPNDPIARYRWLQQQGRASLMDKVRSYYFANILSGVKTHERNIAGNLANVVTNLAVHPFAAGVDALKAAARGTPRTVRLDELPAQVVGAVAGFERGIQDFAFTMRHGVSPDALTRSLRAGEHGKLDVPRVEFKGGAVNPFNIPGRLLDAADTLFRSVSRNQELYGLAHTQAKQEGLTGQRFIDRVAELRAGVTADAAPLRQQADTFATRAVFQEKPGQVAQLLQLGAQKLPALSFVIPFIKTPANIMRQGLEFSPAGTVMKASRQGGRAGSQAQARVAAGTAAAAALAYYAASGRLSGDGPRDPAKRAALMESGWRPNSVRIGDQWVSYQLFQPVSVQAAIIANAFEAWTERGAKPKDAADVVASTMARSANSFLSQSFLSGLFDFVEALKDPDQYAGQFATRTASGMIPLAGAVRTVQQATDPVVRQPKTISEGLKAGLPSLSTDVEPRVDRFGAVVTREGGSVRRAADPFNVASVKHDPVAQELDRLGVTLTLPSPTAAVPGGLTRHEETDVRQRRGQAVRRALEAVMRHPRYEGMADDERAATLERLITRARSEAGAEVRRELVEARAGQTYEHPQYGRVQVMGPMANGTIRVVKVLPDGTVGGRQFIARAGDLSKLEQAPAATPKAAKRTRAERRKQITAARNTRSAAGLKFAQGRPMSRAELESLLPEMSKVMGRDVPYDELKAEANARGIRVSE